MSVGIWIISICSIVIAASAIILALVLAAMIFSIRRTILDVDHKIQAFDPLFRVVSMTGEVVERKAKRSLKQAEEHEEELSKEESKNRIVNAVFEAADLALVGVALWQKLRKRK